MNVSAQNPPGLLGWWKMDETSGTTAADSSGNGFNGTLLNFSGSPWVTGQVSNALAYDGTNDRVEVGNPAALQLTGALTAAAWVRVDSYASNGRIISKGGGSTSRGWNLNVEDTGHWAFGIARDNDEPVAITTPIATTGQWVHVAGVYDPSGPSLRLYLNGVPVTDPTLTGGPVPSSMYNAAETVVIGARGNVGNPQCFFNGRIDDVRLFNEALNWSQIYTISGLSDTTAPSAPSNLQSNTPTSTSVTLTWGASSDNVGVVEYEVFRAGTVSMGTSSATSIDLSNLSPSTNYSITVKARDPAGNLSAASNTVSVTTAASGGGSGPALEGRLRVETSRTIGGAIGDTVAIGSFANDTVGKNIRIYLKGHSGAVIDVQTYEISEVTYTGASTNWLEVPLSQLSVSHGGTAAYAVDVYRQNINSTSDPLFVRVRVKRAVGAGTVQLVIDHDDDSTFTPLTTANTTATTFNSSSAPAGGGVTGYYGAAEWMFPVSNGQGWGSAGSSGLFVKNSGNVGIGTISPSSPLTVVSNTNPQMRIDSVSNLGSLLDFYTQGTGQRARVGWIAAGGAQSGLWLWNYDNSNIVLGTANTQRMTIDVAGNVGIGITNPTAKLHVAGDVTATSFNTTNIGVAGTVLLGSTATSVTAGFNGEFGNPNVVNSGGFRVNRNSTTAGTKVFSSFHKDSTHEFYHEVLSGSDSRFVFNGGNVGIGTTAPFAKLDVEGKVSVGSGTAQNTFLSSDTQLQILTNSGVATQLGFWQSGVASSNIGHKASDSRFYITNGAALGTADKSITLDASGNVGIGTTSPGVKPDVAGTTGVDYLRVDAQDAVNEGGEIAMIGAGSFGTFQIDNFQGNARIHTLAAGKRLEILGGSVFANGTAANYFESSVGIGTTNPGTNKLAVNGTIRAREVIVENTGWPDYVFAPDYDLPTLDEVSAHIESKGHLPGVPSAATVGAQGVAVGEMQQTMMQKIEELTLYIIQQDKRIRELESRLGKEAQTETSTTP